VFKQNIFIAKIESSGDLEDRNSQEILGFLT
jgi:hypothetical protein